MDTSLAKQIGLAARQAREARKLTQADAAERTGISLEFYGRVERGGTLPSTPTLVKLAKALGTSADALLGLSAPTWKRQPSTDPKDGPELRRLVRRLRGSDVRTLRAMNAVAGALEHHTTSRRRTRK